MNCYKFFVRKFIRLKLPVKILFGIIAGIVLAFIFPKIKFIGLLGDIFVAVLKGIAPILVFVLVLNSIIQAKSKKDPRFKTVVFLYLFSTFAAALISVFVSFLFPQKLVLDLADVGPVSPLQNISDVVQNILLNIVSNPVKALSDGNYLGILFWSILTGLVLKRRVTKETKCLLGDFSNAILVIIKKIINYAPLGIMGLIYDEVCTNGIEIFTVYGKLVLLLAFAMLFVCFVANPFIVFCLLKKNPFPLILISLKESGLTAFFTRSSAANIPINMDLCEKMRLDRDMYSVSIPLGATINMSGAAITITIMTLAAVNTLGVSVDILSAVLLSLLAAFAACGASGVAGGSLLLVPMACSLFGISNDIAMQVVAIGFIIGVIQDSLETALNSSSDVVFTATAEFYQKKLNGKSLEFVYNDEDNTDIEDDSDNSL